MKKFGKNAVLEKFFLEKILWTPRKHFFTTLLENFCTKSIVFSGKCRKQFKRNIFFQRFNNFPKNDHLDTWKAIFSIPSEKLLSEVLKTCSEAEIDKILKHFFTIKKSLHQLYLWSARRQQF